MTFGLCVDLGKEGKEKKRSELGEKCSSQGSLFSVLKRKQGKYMENSRKFN